MFTTGPLIVTISVSIPSSFKNPLFYANGTVKCPANADGTGKIFAASIFFVEKFILFIKCL